MNCEVKRRATPGRARVGSQRPNPVTTAGDLPLLCGYTDYTDHIIDRAAH
jgi:hypothetical protein